MNSSGIKRGLAAGAISALAVTGLPLLASSANAAVGDVLKVASVGPALNGGGPGAQILVQATHGSVASPANLKVIGSDLSSNPNTPSQTVVEGTPVAATDSNPNDNLDEYIVPVKVTTPAAGDTAKFAIYNDADNGGDVDAAESRTQVSVTTSGAVASLDVAPASQSVVQGMSSDDYTVTVKDAAGRVTQLGDAETIALAGDGQVDPSVASMDADALKNGSDTFTADATNGATVGAHTITLDGPGTADAKVTATVVRAAQVTASEVDVVTGADSWDGFGDGTDGGTTAVRVDQSSIRIDFKGDDKNSNVTLTVAGNGVTFGGKSSTTVSTVLDENGVGSVTITPDAGSVQEGDSITIGGSFDQTFDYQRAEVSAIEPTADPYFSALKGSVDVVAMVTDQFGLPITTGYVTAQRTGLNADTTPQKKAVGNDGTVTFTFTDTKAVNGYVENVALAYFPDQFAQLPTETGSASIKYTTDGMGSDYKISLGGEDTEAADYKASDVTVVPLADAYDNNGDDSADLDIANGESGSEITVSVNNGALILEPGEHKLSEGSSSITDTVSGGVLAGDYRIVGTKSGVVTVTVESAHRTEMAQMTVAPETDFSTARNISLSGPASVEHGASQITYTAVITDAFGNPIADFPRENVNPLINVQVSGPGQFKDGDAKTNAAGEMNLNVALNPDAVGDVTMRVQGLDDAYFGGTQFGAAADHVYSYSNTKDGEGLAASSDVATATTTVESAPPVDQPKDINLVLNGKDNGAKDDVLKANANGKAAGLVAKLYKKTANGWKWVAKASLNEKGNHKFKVADKNGKKATKYQVRVGASDTTMADTANRKVR